jgi:N-acetylmuramoyl-L-alanine amidase
LPTWTIKQILWDLVLVRSRKHSSLMASHICRSMRDRLGVPCRGVKGARFVVLREAKMPAVLVEVGYVSNRPEASRLASTTYREAIAEAIAAGVVRYIQGLGAQHIAEARIPSQALAERP